MKRKSAAVSVALLLVLFGSACASPSPGVSSPAVGPTTLTKKHIVAAILSDPAGLHQEMTNPSPSAVSVPGLTELFATLDGALTYLDGEYVRHPWLAEAVPSVDNGL